MMSTVTYSIEMYTPDTNVDHVQEVKVQIVGEEFIRTEEKTMIDLANRPQTETQGYVKYQTLETVFYHISKHREEVENMAHSRVFLVTSKVFGTW